jgi:hypothetical protein
MQQFSIISVMSVPMLLVEKKEVNSIYSASRKIRFYVLVNVLWYVLWKKLFLGQPSGNVL